MEVQRHWHRAVKATCMGMERRVGRLLGHARGEVRSSGCAWAVLMLGVWRKCHWCLLVLAGACRCLQVFACQRA